MIEYPSANWKDYELLDSGCGEKLERFGNYVLARPEPKALWDKSMSEEQWRRLTHTSFTPGAGFGKAGKEDSGTWNRHKKMDDQWYISYPGLQEGLKFDLRLGLTSFKHVGVFPEQAPNWEWIFEHTRSLALRSGSSPLQTSATQTPPQAVPPLMSPRVAQFAEGTPAPGAKPRVLNLFAYTGGASLAAKAAGADVTHLDSVRQVVTWARGNMEHSGLDGIRWIVEDAMKFAKREAKRGNLYDGIILDPPAYGHGPDGEKWKLDECLFDMLRNINMILKPENSWVVLNLYSNGFSAALGETVCKQAFKGIKHIESGELALVDKFGKALPLSIVVRLER